MSSSPTSSSSSNADGHPFEPLMDVGCGVDVVIGTAAITVRDCLKLRPRSVVKLRQTSGADLDLSVNGVLAAMAMIKAGRVRPVAMTSLKRSHALPELPTLDESGYKGFEAVAWTGLAAPGKTPADIAGKLNSTVVKIVQSPELKERMLAEGSEPVGNTQEQFRAFLQNEIVKWRKVIQATGLKAK